MRRHIPCRVHLNLQDTPPSSAWTDAHSVGTWLSLVERTLGVGEVASSNLVVPTIYLNHFEDHVEESSTYPLQWSGPHAATFCAASLRVGKTGV
jgi:hypothetical protein